MALIKTIKTRIEQDWAGAAQCLRQNAIPFEFERPVDKGSPGRLCDSHCGLSCDPSRPPPHLSEHPYTPPPPFHTPTHACTPTAVIFRLPFSHSCHPPHTPPTQIHLLWSFSSIPHTYPPPSTFPSSSHYFLSCDPSPLPWTPNQTPPLPLPTRTHTQVHLPLFPSLPLHHLNGLSYPHPHKPTLNPTHPLAPVAGEARERSNLA